MKDSLNKIEFYLEVLSKDKVVELSPKFYRSYKCPANCGACCKSYTMDFFEGKRFENFKKNYPEIELQEREYKGIKVFSEMNSHKDYYCKFLNTENGRCGIHEQNTFTCDIELMRFINRQDKTIIMKRLFGRGWAMKRIDGERGAFCVMTGFDEKAFLHDIDLLEELYDISKLFKAETKLPQILEFLNKNKDKIINDPDFRLKKAVF